MLINNPTGCWRSILDVLGQREEPASTALALRVSYYLGHGPSTTCTMPSTMCHGSPYLQGWTGSHRCHQDSWKLQKTREVQQSQQSLAEPSESMSSRNSIECPRYGRQWIIPHRFASGIDSLCLPS